MELKMKGGSLLNCPDGGTCDFCGCEMARAFWEPVHGKRILICWSCAVTKLPLLIADAIAGPIVVDAETRANHLLTADQFQREVPEILAAFWRGVALAFSRRMRSMRASEKNDQGWKCPQCHYPSDENGTCIDNVWDDGDDLLDDVEN